MSDNNVLISVNGLKKHYKGGEIKALDGVTTDIKKGEVVVIIGPSGSGKSTFLRSLNLLERPTDGHILFDGVDITDKSSDINKLRMKMGMVFQHFNLFPNMSVKENIKLANFSSNKYIIVFITPSELVYLILPIGSLNSSLTL